MFRLLNRCNSCENVKVKNQISVTKCFVCFRNKSFYEVLGLDSTATAKDIKSAYYKLSLQFHPDKNSGSAESVSKFREITEAYEVLGNPEKRKLYDQKGTFQNQYPRNESSNQYYYRPRSYRGPYTGRTQDFDYDEHFRKHYQDFEKMRQAEHEYFRRRWEAEFYRRYPNREDFYNKHFKNQESYEEVKRRFALRKRSFVMLFSLWSLIILFQSLKEYIDPDVPKMRHRVYYEVENKEESKD